MTRYELETLKSLMLAENEEQKESDYRKLEKIKFRDSLRNED